MRSLSPWGGRRLPSSDLFSQFQDFINEFDRGESSALTRAGFDFSPSVDVEEKDNAYLVSADLPGMKKDEIKVELNDNILTISGERTRESKSEGGYSERSYGRFQRSFTLPVQVNSEKIEAHFEDGVLQITVPKAEGARSHSIKIM
ncbi:HspC2 heat shock protein [Bdellovibrio bacteriovorus]|nr:HspC2 heat shock protein [Bdellovibrio bacteriovorus]